MRCHAGRGQAQVIGALREWGLWHQNGRDHYGPFIHKKRSSHRGGLPDRDTLERTEAALRIWQETVPGQSTPVETRAMCRRTAYLSVILNVDSMRSKTSSYFRAAEKRNSKT